MKTGRLIFGVLALVGLIRASSSAQTPECAAKSQRLSALETDLKGNQNAESLKAFWKDVEKTGTPIVERIPNDQADVLVTFVWQGSPSAKQVFIFPQIESTAATDKMKMSRLLDTNLWYKTYCLPEGSRFTYGFYEASTIVENDSPLNHVDQLKTDQFNSRRFEFPPHDSVEGGTTVVFSLFESSHSPGPLLEYCQPSDAGRHGRDKDYFEQGSREPAACMGLSFAAERRRGQTFCTIDTL
jgi:hypothetical protein